MLSNLEEWSTENDSNDRENFADKCHEILVLCEHWPAAYLYDRSRIIRRLISNFRRTENPWKKVQKKENTHFISAKIESCRKIFHIWFMYLYTQ